MDVQDLAPALAAFGRLVREANAQLNGDRANVRLLVTSDFEHRCFSINFELIQNILEFLKLTDIKNADEILATLGIGGAGVGLLRYLKWKAGRETTEKESTGSGDVIVQIKGTGNTINVHRNVIKMSENPKIRTAVEATLAPLGVDKVGTISFRENGKDLAVYDEEDAKDIVASFPIVPKEVDEVEEESEPITAWLRVYSPVFDEHADKWRFIYNEHPIYADISETTIARDAIHRGGAFVNELYKVKMLIKQRITKTGIIKSEYKILQVIDFRLAEQQRSLPI
jgi:hypothetical protein